MLQIRLKKSCILVTVIKSLFRDPLNPKLELQLDFQMGLRSHFENLEAGLEWLNLGSLHTAQGHRDPPEAPAELHCTGVSEVSMGSGESRGHLAGEDEVEEEEEAAEVSRDSWERSN